MRIDADWTDLAAAALITAPRITVTYLAVDGYTESQTFRDREKAKAYALRWVGTNYDMGSTYAVSADGVGRVTVEGLTIRELLLDDPRCSECSNAFDDNPGKTMCKTCEDWLVDGGDS